MIEYFFPKRLHRLSYILRGLTTNGVLCFLESCSTTVDSHVWWVIWFVAILYQIFFIVVPRIRDIGMNGWWVLIALIPVVNAVFGIILAFRAPTMNRPPAETGAGN